MWRARDTRPDGERIAVLAQGAVWTACASGSTTTRARRGDPIVETTVAEFNAMLPRRAPQLRYQAMPEIPCAQISPGLHRGGIVVCTTPSLPSSDELGRTEFSVKQSQLSRARITLLEATNPARRDTIVCHEFMHATTGIRDNYDALPDTSCVWGSLTAPGSFDAQYARKLYKKQADKSSGGKKHGGKKRRGK
jgi:hypothetical protein